MDNGFKKIFFAKYLVEYVGSYNYSHLDDKTRNKLLNQDIFILTSSSPSDYEFLIASSRMSFPCMDGNLQNLYPYYELLCMYAELNFWKKFCWVLHYLDVEVESCEVIESNDAYFDPLYMYYVPSGDCFNVYDVDDDEFIGQCEYLGGPISNAQKCQIIDVDPFEDVLDRYLNEHVERYFPERLRNDQIKTDEFEDIREDAVQSTIVQLDDSVLSITELQSQSGVSFFSTNDIGIHNVVDNTLGQQLMMKEDQQNLPFHSIEYGIVGVITSLLSNSIATISQKIMSYHQILRKGIENYLSFVNLCSENGCFKRPCYYSSSRLIRMSLSLRGLEISLIRKFYVD